MRCRTSTTTKPVTISIAGNRISIAYYMRNFQHAERHQVQYFITYVYITAHVSTFCTFNNFSVKLLVKHDCSWCSY